MEILGDDWGRQQSANILGTLASNPGAGGAAAAGAGIGMGAAVGGVFGSMAQQMFRPMTSEQTTPYQQAPSGRFQQGTVTQANSSRQSEDDSVEVLSKLKKMLDLGLIEQE